jgi:hypothetical protein
MYADKPINKASKGTIYVVSIAIPNASDRDLKEAEFSEVFVQGEMLYQKVDIDGNTLTLNTYNENDKIIDSFTITK